MSKTYSSRQVLKAIVDASIALSSRKEEINKLNVFPVPDGDTGTNMSLTIESVINNLKALSPKASGQDTRKAIVTGALMGARGNSGVITSQILRGLCEGSADYEELSTEALAASFAKAAEVAFQAVRKPVEGTILTVLRDSAEAAKKAAEDGLGTDDALDVIVTEAYASVQRTPEFLPVLKENNVVDAGGFGLSILFDGFSSSLQGKSADLAESYSIIQDNAPKVEIEHINDWEDSDYRYCNEFLVDSDTLDPQEALDFLATMGDCELCVGQTPKFKVHVHSNHPDQVLKYFLERGQVFEVFIHNMDMQSEERVQKIAAETATVFDELENVEMAKPVPSANAPVATDAVEEKPIGFVAVAPGDGNANILRSLGVDVVVSGGQTMNPSTKDLMDAIEAVPSDKVIVLPNNSNIIMAANSACELSDKECAVVPTKSVPQAFAAMFVVDEDASVEDNASAMEEAASEVKTGEVTTAIKNSRDAHRNRIKKGDVIGIADGSIEAVGRSVEEVVLQLLSIMKADEADTLTLLAGEDLTPDQLESIMKNVEVYYPDLEIDSQKGGQPLYPMVFSLE